MGADGEEGTKWEIEVGVRNGGPGKEDGRGVRVDCDVVGRAETSSEKGNLLSLKITWRETYPQPDWRCKHK